jgi:hypothetical protein
VQAIVTARRRLFEKHVFDCLTYCGTASSSRFTDLVLVYRASLRVACPKPPRHTWTISIVLSTTWVSRPLRHGGAMYSSTVRMEWIIKITLHHSPQPDDNRIDNNPTSMGWSRSRLYTPPCSGLALVPRVPFRWTVHRASPTPRAPHPHDTLTWMSKALFQHTHCVTLLLDG